MNIPQKMLFFYSRVDGVRHSQRMIFSNQQRKFFMDNNTADILREILQELREIRELLHEISENRPEFN